MSNDADADDGTLPIVVSTGELPPRELVDRRMREAYEVFRGVDEGAIATYIPALASASPRAPAAPNPARFASSGGTRVVLPVPGGAWTTAEAAASSSAAARASSDSANTSPRPIDPRSKGRAGFMG